MSLMNLFFTTRENRRGYVFHNPQRSSHTFFSPGAIKRRTARLKKREIKRLSMMSPILPLKSGCRRAEFCYQEKSC